MSETKTIDRLVGERVTPEFVKDLLTPGRVNFNFKPTYTNTKSYASKDDASTIPVDFDIDKSISDFVDNVKENEDLVKQLEDMMNDLLKDMNIKPKNGSVAAAATRLGSPDGSITFDIFKRAETILDPVTMAVNQTGQNPVLGALTGNAAIKGPFLACNEVTSAIADAWEQVQNENQSAAANEQYNKYAGTASDMNESFGKKIAAMIKEIIMGILFNEFWPRIMSILISQLEKLLCKPIDLPLLLIRFKKPNQENFYKYGTMHRKFSMFKFIMLCKIPLTIMTKAKLEYKPSTEIKVGFVYKKQSWLATKFAAVQKDEHFESGSIEFAIVRIKDVCGIELGLIDCEADPTPTSTAVSGTDLDGDDGTSKLNAMKAAIDAVYPVTDDEKEDAYAACMEKLTKLYDEQIDGPGIPSECLNAAKTILDAVYDTALGQPEVFNNLANFGAKLQSALGGKASDMEKANAV